MLAQSLAPVINSQQQRIKQFTFLFSEASLLYTCLLVSQTWNDHANRLLSHFCLLLTDAMLPRYPGLLLFHTASWLGNFAM